MLPVIEIENLSKLYQLSHLGPKHTLRDAIVYRSQELWNRIRIPAKSQARQATGAQEEFWALKDVSFKVMPGERLGIIGRNGAGKSTLLKILSRITEPTQGRAVMRGRVASLLEVGTGFHQELTGRENIYLNGAILGMSRSEINRKFDDIVAFSEVERFLDTPVKRYSSGMYVRLAFAVAAHLEPDVLILDEVLAVGDAQFQKKCLGKISEVEKQGRTVIFVSHNMTAVRSLCNKAILLRQGQVAYQGDTDEAIALYMESDTNIAVTEKTWASPLEAPGNEHLRLKHIKLIPEQGTPIDGLSIRDSFNIEFSFWNLKPDARLSMSMHMVTPEETVAFASTTWREENWNGKPFPKGTYSFSCRIPGDLLNVGPYRLRLYFLEDGHRLLTKFDDIFEFELNDSLHDRGDWHSKWDGVVRPLLAWEAKQLDLAEPL